MIEPFCLPLQLRQQQQQQQLQEAGVEPHTDRLKLHSLKLPSLKLPADEHKKRGRGHHHRSKKPSKSGVRRKSSLSSNLSSQSSMAFENRTSSMDGLFSECNIHVLHVHDIVYIIIYM